MRSFARCIRNETCARDHYYSVRTYLCLSCLTAPRAKLILSQFKETKRLRLDNPNVHTDKQAINPYDFGVLRRTLKKTNAQPIKSIPDTSMDGPLRSPSTRVVTPSSSRTLAPATSSPSSLGSSSRAPARKNNPHACNRCRLVRTKCSGGSPCDKCSKDGAICILGEGKRERNRKS
jgi:hypothetical protein